MSDLHSKPGSNKVLLTVVALILTAYGVSLTFGWPQEGTELIRHAAAHDDSADETEHAEPLPPSTWMVLPFVLLLGSIAVLPMIPATEEWLDSNWNRFIVALVLAAVTLLYYMLLHDSPVEAHWPAHGIVYPNEHGPNLRLGLAVLANAILHEYIPFVMLLFSLYTISGGIRIEGDLHARPRTNAAFIAVGGLLASFIGTTGAAMLLIRPLLETNAKRRHKRHTVVFFIFVVCNCGGCLLPIGDPPLFLGYLRGVPFTWTFGLWPQWLFVNVVLIAIYYLVDRFWYYRREDTEDIARNRTEGFSLRFLGLWPNVLLLAGVVLSVALLDPSKPVPGTGWHPWMYLREVVQLALVAISLGIGSREIRLANHFSYHAIIEVAALFFGIFICMQPMLQILRVHGPQLPLSTPSHFFWLTGSLSAVLDNAPTYVVFFTAAASMPESALPPGPMVSIGQGQISDILLAAISLGAVFMGAMTYIGNGPNFMVKAIAERYGVEMPGFFGYMLYSCGILLPLLYLTNLLFL